MLFVCLVGFLGQEYYNILGLFDIKIFDISIVSTNNSSGLTPETLQNLLGLGVVFSEFVIVLISMLDRVGETLRDIIKPLFRLIPFGVFMFSMWKAFSPIVFKLLPVTIAESVGVATTNTDITQTISQEIILTSLVAMVLFVIAHNALGVQRESEEAKKLRAENARLRKELRRGL